MDLLPLLLTHVHLVDHRGAQDVDCVAIQDGVIQSVGACPQDTSGYRVLDLQGKTVAPGLIDCHVHLSLTPSGHHIQPTAQEEQALWRHHLAAYLASGVTTVLDTGILPQHARSMNQLAATGPSPSLYYLGPLVSPPGGYVHAVLPQYPAAHTPQELHQQIDAFADLNPVGIKITVESGMLVEVWDLYPQEIQAELVTLDHRLMAHAISPAEATLALDLGAAALVHPVSKPTPELLERLAAAQTPVISTISVFDTLLWGQEPERFEDPDLAMLVPEAELSAAQNPEWRKQSAQLIAQGMLPDSRPWVQRLAARAMDWKRPIAGQVQTALDSVAVLNQAGVPIVMGSDSGNWPIFLYEFHGVTSQAEVQLLARAGLTPLQVLTASTLSGAALIGIDDQVGTLAEGYRADLLVLSGDPLQDVRAWGEIEWVVSGGVVASPAEWMARVPVGTLARDD
ncbi:MAG: imidazolonepropionase-like amidohydrolase [Cognaticolwellia sp.]|jgi:imidazolonepropionase-like amidohydrolase